MSQFLSRLSTGLGLGASWRIALGLSIALGSLLLAPGAYALCPDNGLIGHWSLDGNGIDVSGCAPNGTVNGATPTPDEAGAPDSALLFDGVNDFVDLGTSSALKPPLPVTISAYLRNDCPITENCWIFENAGNASTYRGVSFAISIGHGLYAQYGSGTGASASARRSANAAGVLTPGAWHHVAVVIAGPTDFRFYVDGVRLTPAQVTLGGTGGPMVYDPTPVATRIGLDHGVFNDFFAGVLDEVRFYDRALSDGEIAGLGPCVGPDGLVGHWPMDGDATDATACGNDGAVNGAVLTTDRTGAPDSAYELDGIDDTIDLGTSPVLKPGLPLSVSMWLRNECPPAATCDLLQSDVAAGVYSGVRVYVQGDGTVAVRYGDGGPQNAFNRRTTVGTTPLAPGGSWQHLAIVLRGPTDTQLYIDGVRDAVSYSGSGDGIAYPGGPVLLGSTAGSFDGAIDDLRIYNRALTPGEVAAMLPDDCVGPDGLLGYWPIAGDASDATACLNDGVVSGATLVPDIDGNPASAYEFDGVDDIIDFGAANELHPNLPLSLSLQIRHQCAGTCRIFTNDRTSLENTGFWLTLNAGALTAYFGNDGGVTSTSYRAATAATMLDPGVWYHLTVVVRGPVDFDIYIDGAPDALSYSGTGGALAYLGNPTLLGSDAPALVPFQGTLDQVRFYDRALGSVEAAELAWSARVVGEQKISDTSGYLSSPGTPGSNPGGFLVNNDTFGTPAGIGDLDGDSIPDIVVGIPRRDLGGFDRGSVVVLLLNADGTVKSRVEIGHGSAGLSLSDGDNFGDDLSNLGDVDGDGVTDIAVAAYGDSTGAPLAGAAYILFLNANGTLKSFQKITEGVGGGPSNLDETDYFGADVGALGDINGDAIPDLVVGAPGDDDAGPDAGAVYVLLLKGGVGEPNPGQVLGAPVKIAAGQAGFVGPPGGNWFGYSSRLVGDLDGDLRPEIAVGNPLSNEAGAASGSVWILSLCSAAAGDSNIGEVCGEYGLNATSEPAIAAEIEAGDWLGDHLAELGDLDGDGIPDLAVAAYQDDDGGLGRGAVYLFYLNSDKTLRRLEKISSTRGGFAGALDNGDGFGFGLGLVGDLSGDGTPEFAVAARNDFDGGSDRGAVYLLSLDFASTCGDAIPEPNEECDDGNQASADGCSSMCVVEFCSDGILQTGIGEQCDDGNLLSEDGCSSMCIAEFCGDGILQAGLAETCDDGNSTPFDGCSATCAQETAVSVIGNAAGGALDYTIAGVTVSIATTPGQSAAQVAAALAAAINANTSLSGMGIAAGSTGDQLFHDDMPSAFAGTDPNVALATSLDTLLGDLSVIPRTLDFESFFDGDPVPDASSIQGISFGYSLSGEVAIVTDAFATESPIQSLGLTGGDEAFLDGDTLSFTLPRPVLAIGIYVVTSDPAAAGEILLVTPQGTSSNSATPIGIAPDGGFIYFLAHIAAVPFSSATLDFAADGGTHFVYTIDDLTAAVPTVSSTAYTGVATGGFIVGAVVDGFSIQITTTSGATAAQVALALALAINSDPTLRQAGTAAAAVGDEVLTNGTITVETNEDPGLGGGATAVPSAGPIGLSLLAAALAAAGMAFEARRRAAAARGSRWGDS